MSDVIKQLYNGTIRPFDEIHEPTLEREAAIRKYRTAEQHFIELHPECKYDLEVMLSEYAELESYTAYEQFALGFRAGAQLMLEALRPIK